MDNNSNNSFLKPYLEPAFIICVILLALAAAGLPLIEHTFGLYLRKKPIPLKKSLDLLDSSLAPTYKIVRKEQIEIEDVEKTLGTNNYIQWIIEDANAPSESLTRYCMLFITYYDMPDNVPHIPEVCYIGGGNVMKSSEGADISIKNGDFDKTIPIRYLSFENSEGSFAINVTFGLCYLIYSNEMYANSRNGARIALNRNIFKKYSYFSKVEWKFFGSSQFSMAAYPKKEEVIQASEKLLSVILPALEKDHWPDSRDVKN
jgi:hypothetical protein